MRRKKQIKAGGHLSSWKVEAGGSEVQGHPWLTRSLYFSVYFATVNNQTTWEEWSLTGNLELPHDSYQLPTTTQFGACGYWLSLGFLHTQVPAFHFRTVLSEDNLTMTFLSQWTGISKTWAKLSLLISLTVWCVVLARWTLVIKCVFCKHFLSVFPWGN